MNEFGAWMTWFIVLCLFPALIPVYEDMPLWLRRTYIALCVAWIGPVALRAWIMVLLS